MDKKVFSNASQNSELKNNELNEYEYLILRLRKIKESITALENNFLFKKY